MKSARPALIFDGDCGFCRLWIERWRLATGDRVEYLPSGDAGARFPKLAPADLSEAVHLVESDGTVRRGAEAVFRAMDLAGGVRRAGYFLYRRVPPFAAAAEAAYAFVAARRPAFSRLTRLLWGPSPVPAPIDGAARALLAGLGLCYLVAFWSFGVQVRGLIGRDGIAPAASYLAAVARQVGPEGYWRLPTLAWFGASDAALVGLCAAGAAAALGLILDVAAGPCALACWALYLSLSGVGSVFMGYQWDVLLLETGLIAFFLAPWSWSPRTRTETSRGALLLMRLLLFKLMLQSGMVKLLSGDFTWRHLTALTFHYWTQPLPTPLAWWTNRLPLAAQKVSCAFMFAVELGAPWLLLGPRRVRAFGAALIATLMVLISLTGNYGFFNLLTLTLCLSALDDSAPLLARFARKTPPRAPSRWRARALAVFAALWLAVSGVQWSLQCGLTPPFSGAWVALLNAVEPLRSINSYGLFAMMTTTRDEIMVEVSADGHVWKEWPFRWKPGDPSRAPRFVAPHMPRLDWQMWFAALGAPSPWMNNLIFRLLQDSPPVMGLMGPSPLGGAAPVYARATVWATRFSTAEERRADGSWWKRERKGLYFPVVSLKH
ncbi:MAG: lipase maturation factor family protein, partial [Elusimicrobia bacterium]|nr:lipase maturation factor family protein [Elusimicrobiota bacterium]